MATFARPAVAPRKSNARVPTSRPPPSRAQSATPTLTGRASPADTTTSTTVPLKSPARSVNGGTKRKERDFEREVEEETNINVVVRCRGRSDREVRENSGVVVSTQGVKGSKVDLSMGPSALSNKTYSFDKVFSPAADQEMLFNEVVSPILDEVLGGFNCTIFAYGQTGTGKTYTMSGDITDTQPLPEAAGIIPRVLYSLFERLGEDDGENSVKCSFIELYNEELRDLLSHEENSKLKIYDDNSKKGQTTTLVQGMEESHIKTASKGLELLRRGSHKRQVAATKCNDLSSRSHTVFTVTVYMKKTSDTGEDFVSAGKLNLVDLAGSENIQRSGAENKRAAEAGLINKSLLTLGRVINALVERSTHIPYRESKLTRLLQDSLGGRTKTCIVATLSPAKSNLEETISTLDYAFRAKNIKNKPQANSMVSKKTLLRDFTSEIEKLKGELVATRSRNGIYLTQEAFEEITTASESRRILSEEQRDKIEIMETSLRNKVQELYNLTNTFSTLKKDNETAKFTLDSTQSLLEKTELVLQHTKKSLAEEVYVRRAHQATEQTLLELGDELLGTVELTTGHVRGLHAKLRRRSDLHGANRDAWVARQQLILMTTQGLDLRMEDLRNTQGNLLQSLSERMESYVSDELKELEQSQRFLNGKVVAFTESEAEVNLQTTKAKDDMNNVLSEIRSLREDVKEKVGVGMRDLSEAAQSIAAGISSELDAFHTQLHSSYSSLGKDFKSIFDDVNRQLTEQKGEIERLQQEITVANQARVQAEREARDAFKLAIDAEMETAAKARAEMLSQITALVDQNAAAQDSRVNGHIKVFDTRYGAAQSSFESAEQRYNESMKTWSGGAQSLLTSCLSSRDSVKAKIKADWSNANSTTEKLRSTAQSVHGQTLDVVNAQTTAMDSQLSSLDEIIARVKTQNETHHATHISSLSQLSKDVQESYTSIGEHMGTSQGRAHALQEDISARAADLSGTFPSLSAEGDLRSTLSAMREEVSRAKMAEYVATGSTPAKMAYSYPTSLPKTEARDALVESMHGGGGRAAKSPRLMSGSPRQQRRGAGDAAKPGAVAAIYVDADAHALASGPDAMDVDGGTGTVALPQPNPRAGLERTNSLRDLDPNRSVAAQLSSSPELVRGYAPSCPAPGPASTSTDPSLATEAIEQLQQPSKHATKLPSLFSRSMTAPAPPSSRGTMSTTAKNATSKRATIAAHVTPPTLPSIAVGQDREKENVAPAGTVVAEKLGAGPAVGNGVGAGIGQLLGVGSGEREGGQHRRSGRLLRGRGSD